MKIVIIGNGACALRNESGSFINGADLVIRVGEFIIDGFEKYIGNKTDIYVSRWFKSKTRSKIFFNSLQGLWIPRTYETRELKYDTLIEEYGIREKISYIPLELIYRYKLKYPYKYVKHNNSKTVNKNLYCCLPDSGIVAIDMALMKYPQSQIYIVGYDNCKTGYYWEPKRQLDNVGPDMMLLQQQTLKSYIEAKKIINLNDSI
jgi:hypothetical protein